MEALLPVVLVVQGVMGGVYTLLNHEMIARLPKRPEARTEIGLHVIREAILTLNLGLLIALLVPILLEWGKLPTALVPQSYGAWSWILSFLALAAGTWSLRDLLAWRRLGYARGG